MEPSGATPVPLILLEASLNLLSLLLVAFPGDYFNPHYLQRWFVLLVYSLQISPSSHCFVLADPHASASPGDSVIQFLPGAWQIARILAVSHWLPCVLMKMLLEARS